MNLLSVLVNGADTAEFCKYTKNKYYGSVYRWQRVGKEKQRWSPAYKGAGKAIAERLARAGATIIITARNKPEKMNVEFHYIAADLSSPEGTEKSD